MKSILGLLTLAAVAGCTTALPPSELEAIRVTGARSRERLPHHAVGGYGTLEQAKALIATGEAEEIDYWRLAKPPRDDERAALRKAFDEAGGRAVQILGPGEEFRRRDAAAAMRVCGTMPYDVLAAGTDRALLVDEDGAVAWEKRGCGNIHSVVRRGRFIYYSNGSLYRVPLSQDKWANPQLVWRPEDVTGGGVLCFAPTDEGTFVMGVNSTSEVVEFDPQTAKVVTRFAVDAKNAKGELPPPHGRIRSVHKLGWGKYGTYLVCCAGAETVREYEGWGKCIWSVKAPAFVFDAVRRPNGNTVVSHVTGLTEYTPEGKVAWTLTPADLPDLKVANFTALDLCENGNLIVGTWANGTPDASHVTAFEVTPAKRVVWALASSTDINMMGVRKDTGRKGCVR